MELPTVSAMELPTVPAMERIEETIFKHRVAIFSKSYCPYCNQVKKLFESLDVAFFALELDLLGEEGVELQDALFKKTNQKSVPNVFIRGNHIGGCDSTMKAYNDGRLVNLLEGTNVVYDYDLVVIGGGSGGLAASKEAAILGRKVAVCDFVVPTPKGTTWGLGGTCVNVGCIPKKLMHQASIVGTNIKEGTLYGWRVPDKVEHDWTMMVEEIQQYIKSLNWGYRVALKDKGVTYLNALAEIIDPHRIKLTDKKRKVTEITTRHVIIAVGGRPMYPDIPGAREYGITSDDLFSLPKSPGKTLLIGASYIALECAGFLAGLGYDVTVMVRSILLRGFDQQIANMIGEHMKSHGVKFIEGCVPTAIESVETEPIDESDPSTEVEYSPPLFKVLGTKCDDSEYSDEFNTVVFAIGREACTKNLGLVSAEVTHDKRNGKIIVDEKEQTSTKNVFAVGDVLCGKPELTPVAIQAGRLLARRLYDNHNVLMDYVNIPTTVFTPLEYGCVGFSEEAAIEKYGEDNIEVYHSHFQPLEYALGGRDPNSCYAKLICVRSEEDLVVGFHYLGPDAGEVTQGFAIAVKLKAKKADFAALVGIHPTCAEVFTTMSVTKASGASVDKTSC